MPPEPPIDAEELMARVRAALATGGAGEDPGEPVVLAPNFHQEQLLLDQAQRIADVGTAIPPFGALPRVLRPLARLVTWALYRVLQVVTVDQRVFNNLLLTSARMHSLGLAQGEAGLGDRLRRGEQRAAALERQLAALETAVAAHGEALVAMERRIETVADAEAARTALRQWIDTEAPALRRAVAAAQASLAADERRLLRLAAAQSAGGAALDAAVRDEAAHALDALYVAFEDRFRGHPADISERLRVYLPDVRAVIASADDSVLDLGCGRGEWLALLREAGIRGRGVDDNRLLVAHCRDAGLDVVEADAVAHLAAAAEASAAVVTAFHLIEHLPYGQLVALFDHAARVLRPGGLLIVETPNPDNMLVASSDFHLDPTHRRPLPSPLVRFLAEARGFRDVAVRPLHPAPEYARFPETSELATRLNAHFHGPRDYAVLAYRA
ncbi:methyltransferase domain-containing protein [bacterium]|nr:methyltransferase domain-containing protein [bacterium]